MSIVALNETFGRWLVISGGEPSPRRKFVCLCQCGAVKSLYGDALRAGRTNSCGCARAQAARARMTRHDLSKTRLYGAWCAMLSRCLNPRRQQYKDYGGRGIRVCQRWRSFENFLADMGEPPPGMTLDRIDPDGNYSPDNCRWATWREQQRNRRSNIRVCIDGVTKTLVEWVEHFGINPNTFRSRLRSGWDVVSALTRKVP